MSAALAPTTTMGGGFISEGGQFFYVRGSGVSSRSRTSATSSSVKNSVPVLVKDVAGVEIGHAPRLEAVRLQQNG
jgi:Cu/Ag efflux pump CusA